MAKPHPISRSRLPALLTLLVGLAAFESSCATPEWQRPGSTHADLERERKQCFDESGNTSGVMNWTTSRYVDRCLRERGWTRDDGSQPPVAGAAAPAETPAPAPDPAAAAPAPSQARLTFDECFERCRELTDRSKEACFDVCLDAR